MNRIFESEWDDPYRNLALEEAILNAQGKGVSLYLWQNRNTVVIGRNQNAWKECRVSLLESEGGMLARRSSGGGAVFHDLGNLNFTFVADRNTYDVARQLSVLNRAVAAFDLRAETSGRNDVTLAGTGEKFSGNAFYKTERVCLHHGTILVDADMEKLSRYLAPSPEKLAAKGVDSVRARVTNLAARVPGLSVAHMKLAMTEAFRDVYGPATRCGTEALDALQLETLRQKYASWDWRFGKTPAFDLSLTHQFMWGGVELLLTVRDGRVSDARAYTDAMDESLADTVAGALSGARCTGPELGDRLSALSSPQATELGEWLRGQSL